MPFLLIRKVNESTQRENWQGFALFLGEDIRHPAGSYDTVERRLTEPEKANQDPAARMVEAAAWAETKGYDPALGWEPGSNGHMRAKLRVDEHLDREIFRNG